MHGGTTIKIILYVVTNHLHVRDAVSQSVWA
jgi:hypothetical protein